MDLTILSNIAMFSLVIGTLPAFYTLIKERKKLKGFSLIMAIGVFIGQSLFTVFFFLSNDYLTTTLSLPLVAYWVLVLFFLIRGKLTPTFKIPPYECIAIFDYPDIDVELSIEEKISHDGEYYCYIPLLGRMK
jgi:hypothetical protein